MKRLRVIMLSIAFLMIFLLQAPALAAMNVDQFASDYKKTWKQVTGKTAKFLPGKAAFDPEILAYAQLSGAVRFNVGEIAAGRCPYVAVTAELATVSDEEIAECAETMAAALLVGMSILAPETKQAAANAVIATIDSMLGDSTADAGASSCNGKAEGDWFVHVDYDGEEDRVIITVGHVPGAG